jgi:hypothetical protein
MRRADLVGSSFRWRPATAAALPLLAQPYPSPVACVPPQLKRHQRTSAAPHRSMVFPVV